MKKKKELCLKEENFKKQQKIENIEKSQSFWWIFFRSGIHK